MTPAPAPVGQPDFDRDVVVERHVVAGVEAPVAGLPAWSVWVGRSRIERADSREEALRFGAKYAREIARPLWLCERGRAYTCVWLPSR